MEQAVEQACSSIPELVVPAVLLTAEQIHRLAARVHEAKEEMMKLQLELNLQIVELQLRAQPFTPPEVREQCAHAIQTGLEEIERAVKDCTAMLDQSLFMLTSL